MECRWVYTLDMTRRGGRILDSTKADSFPGVASKLSLI